MSKDDNDNVHSTADAFYAIESTLAARLSALPASKKVTHVYNPLDYARAPHLKYLRKYVDGPKKVLFLGMNPGPWGMMQTGVPFGEVSAVRDWMGIEAEVEKPAGEHPKRPVTGFACPRREVSGERLWRLIKELCGGRAEDFFRHCVVHNHCPLGYLASSGKNVTPVDMAKAEREELLRMCDEALAETIALLETEVGRLRYLRATCHVSFKSLPEYQYFQRERLKNHLKNG